MVDNKNILSNISNTHKDSETDFTRGNFTGAQEKGVTEIKLEMLRELHKKQQALFELKNRKYNDSFGKTFKEYGNSVLCIRLDDKLGRLKSLLLKDEEGTDDESVLDTLQDLANYANMAIIELMLKQEEEI